jgi:hypothetical protein
MSLKSLGGWLLLLDLYDIPSDFSRWVADFVDPVCSQITVGYKHVDISKSTFHRILGLPIDGLEVPCNSNDGKEFSPTFIQSFLIFIFSYYLWVSFLSVSVIFEFLVFFVYRSNLHFTSVKGFRYRSCLVFICFSSVFLSFFLFY